MYNRDMDYQGVAIARPGHDTVVLQGAKTVVIDPFRINALDTYGADLVLLTHDHFDHLSPEDLARTIDPKKTALVGPESCMDKLLALKAWEIEFMVAGNQRAVNNVVIRAVPAYNLNKFKSPGVPFHPKEAGYLGYIITLNEATFYHAGDTDFIDEMQNLGPIDVMFVPVSGTYVMTVDEAVEAVQAVKPKVAVPMHYGAIVGDKAQAEAFKQKVGDFCRVEIL
jgi:L-ascorbate metabolism protein UlaG (beta-lactamase superfamily)